MADEIKKEEFSTQKIGNSIYLRCHNTKPLIQISDGFDRITLSYVEIETIIDNVRKHVREKR